MKSVFEHIEHVKGKPHHVRKRIAFGAAGGITLVIAFIWLAGSLATGAFALGGSAAGGQPAPAAGGAGADSGLAGAAAALRETDADAPARIEIIDAASSSRSGNRIEQTTLPF